MSNVTVPNLEKNSPMGLVSVVVSKIFD